MRLFLRLTLLLLGLVPWVMSAQAQTAFSCDGTFYQIRQVGTTSSIYRVDRSSSAYTTVPVNVVNGGNDLGVLVNGLAYNSQDGFMYALTTTGTSTTLPTSISLYKISTNSITNLGTVTGLPNIQVASGTFDKTGHYYVSSQNSTGTADYKLYRFDLNSTTPLAATNLAFRNAANSANENDTFYDIAYNPLDNFLYGVHNTGQLWRIDQTTNAAAGQAPVTAVQATASTGASPIGTAFFDVAGNLYAYSNGNTNTANSGAFYQVNLSTGVFTQISAIDPASVSDGASCINPGNSIDVTKTLNNVRAVNAYTFDITYSIRVRNTYTTTLPNVQVSDILTGSTTNSTFPTATSVALAPSTAVVVTNLDGSTLAANASFTGTSTTTTGTAMNGASLLSGTQALTAGQRAIITYTVRVVFGTSASTVPTAAQNNTAYATSSSTSPNRGYTLASAGSLLSPSDLVANDASTNTADFPVLRVGDPIYGTPMAVDMPSPTPVMFAPSISGTVFEDVNYGGGLGRSQGNSNGVGRPGARVELYSGTGATATYVGFQTTAADGSYSFTGLTAGNSYVVRVVNSTVTSSRNTGSATGLVGVQTYRTSVTAAAGTTPDPNRVGGEYPALVDAGNGSTTLGALTLSTTSTPESITNVTLASFNSSMNTPAVDVDFGYNFDTVVNTNSSGQGSLAQFITNANALNNTGLNQDPASTGGNDPVAGVETSIFMITDGRAHDGLTAYSVTTNPGLASQLSGSTAGVGGTVANITPTAVLPTLTGTYSAYTSIDATTQTQNVGDTNGAVLGTGGTVGTGSTALSKVNGPEVQLTGGTSIAYGLDVAASATNTTIKGLAIYDFGNSLDNDAGANIRSAANGLSVTQSVLGTTATSFSQPTTATNADNIRLIGGTSGISISNNLIGYSNSKGISIGAGVTNVSVTDNEIRSNGLGGSNYDGVDIQGSSATITGNLLTGTSGQGVDSYHSTGGNTINGNTITDNGRGTVVSGVGETPGVRIYGAGNTISQNVISDNYGAGIMLEGTTGVAAVSNTTISQNSIFNNGNVLARNNTTAATGQIGIDLEVNGNNESGGTSPYVTTNSTTTTGANSLLNFPILTSTVIVGNNLVVTGYAKPGALVELFTAQPNPAGVNATGTYYGQGKNYLTSFTVGTTGGSSYSGTINGVSPGSDTNAQAFTVTLPLTSGAINGQAISSGLLLTSTATLNNATSEFSSNARVIVPPVPNDVTNNSVPDNTVVGVVLNPNVSATASGLTGNITTSTANTIVSYTVSPITSGGVLYYNGTAVTAATSVPAANIGQLTFIPTRGFTGNAVFTYTTTDADGLTSTTHNTGGTTTSGPATYTIPVTPSADVTASLTGGTTLNAGLPTGYYTATFTNFGPDAASSVTQTVALPTSATVTTAQRNIIMAAYPGTTFSTSGSVTTIVFPAPTTMANGAINAYRFAFTAPTATGSSTIVASTSTTSSEGTNVAPNTATLNLNTTAVTDLQATIAAPAATVAPGAAATLTATFTNNSTQPAAGAVGTVQLPVGITPTSVSGVTGTTSGTTVTYSGVATFNTTTGLLTYLANSVAGSFTASSDIVFTMPTTGIVTGTVSITTTTPETNTTNNVASASIAAAPSFDLSTTISGPTSVVAGSPITLNVTTTNGGPQAVAGAVQTVQLPAGLNATGAPNVFISNGGTYNNTSGVVTFPALGSLPSGQTVANTISFLSPTASFTPVATVTPNTTAAGETNTNNNVAYLNGAANSTATGATLAPGTATTLSANIYAILSTTSTIVPAGTQVTYTTGVGNAGASTASNVTGQLQLIPGLGLTTLTVAGSSGTVSGGIITYTNGASYNPTTGLLIYPSTATLISAATTTFAVVVTVPATVGNGGQLLATASVGSATSDAVPADNVKAVAITVLPTSDVTTTIAGPTSGVVAGQSVTYTATFTNNGPDAASTTTENVQLPAGFTTANLLVNGLTGSLSGTTITYTSGGATVATYSQTTGLVTMAAIASDAAGAVQSVNLTFPAPAQNYVVSSTISSATTDTNLTNNAASVATTVAPTTDVAIAVVGPATAVAGSYVTYTVLSTNNGPSTATGVIPTLQLPTGLTIIASGTGTAPAPSFNYNSTSGLLTFPTLATLQSGVSSESYVTFVMPNATAGQISAVASVSSTSTDNVPSNNTAALTTSVAPTTTNTADLRTTLSYAVTSPVVGGSTATAGSIVTYTAAYRNAGPDPATGVVPLLSLPVGLSATTLQVGGVTGTLANGLITFSGGTAVGATYDVATGLLTFPTIPSLAMSSTANSYNVSFPAPGSGPLIVISTINSETFDNVPSSNSSNSNIAIVPAFDLTTSLTGPAVALPGTQNVYTVTTTNSGPSAAAATQTVTLPTTLTTATLLVAGQAGTLNSGVITFPNGATYTTSTGVLAFPTISSLAPGSVTNSFTVTMPSSGTITATATVSTSTSGETNTGNNTATLPTSTATPSFAPVAENIINRKQSARGSTSNTNLSISGLNATDSDGVINNYTITSLPTSGTLYYNGIALTAANYPVADTSLLSYKPASSFVGNAFFTYTATDNRGVVSNSALYTIPVAQDQASTYTAYNTAKGGSNTYKDADVLAQLIDANTARYNSSSIIYNTLGALQSGASNGLPTTGTNATLPSTGPAGNPSNTLPSGVSLDPATGRIYVSNASQLPKVTTATTYSVNVITTDINGGVNQVLATFTIGAYPLPVTLVAFTAQAVQNRDALLNWSTASEKNNDHFDIERSFDGTRFTKIGQVAGHGTTTAASTYTLTDANVAAKANGPVYYRLHQVDLDGTATYSPVRTVSFTSVSGPVALSLYPNPAQASTTLELSQLPTTGTYQVTMLDATGRTVRNWTLAGGLPQPLDVQQLATGAYLLLVTGQQPDGSALKQTLRFTKE